MKKSKTWIPLRKNFIKRIEDRYCMVCGSKEVSLVCSPKCNLYKLYPVFSEGGLELTGFGAKKLKKMK